MSENFAEMLAVGGKSNSLGKVSDVIKLVLHDQRKLDALYECMLNEDAWVRMRAADAFEKICREQPAWILPYVDRFANDLGTSSQAAIQWHLAQIYQQVDLTNAQRSFAIQWLKQLLSTKEVDWIVAANAMDTLVLFTKNGYFPADNMGALLKIQLGHKSNAVVKRATKLLGELSS